MITNLYRYPVKGLSPEPLTKMSLTVEHGLAGDRVFAIARKPEYFDPEKPKAEPKTKFIMLMRDEALAALNTHMDDGRLIIEKAGDILLDVDAGTQAGEVETFFADYVGDEKLSPRWVNAPGHKFTDISVVSPEKMRAISIINLNSVRALEKAVGTPIDPLRFRANIYIDDVPAWAEFDWMDQGVSIGSAKAKIVMRTRRCAATQVNPSTAQRDLDIPALIKQHFGHMDMGVYAEVSSDGVATKGEPVTLI